MALYRGFVPQFLRLFPWNVIVSFNEFLSFGAFCVFADVMYFMFVEYVLSKTMLFTIFYVKIIIIFCFGQYCLLSCFFLVRSVNGYWPNVGYKNQHPGGGVK